VAAVGVVLFCVGVGLTLLVQSVMRRGGSGGKPAYEPHDGEAGQKAFAASSKAAQDTDA
jgi:hypothetical protein